jgi:hypothetical protein
MSQVNDARLEIILEREVGHPVCKAFEVPAVSKNGIGGQSALCLKIVAKGRDVGSQTGGG